MLAGQRKASSPAAAAAKTAAAPAAPTAANPSWTRLAQTAPGLVQLQPAGQPPAAARPAQTPDEFEANGPYVVTNFLPSTKSGYFDGSYRNGLFVILVRVKFRFFDRNEKLAWPKNDQTQQNQFKQDYLTQIGQFWTSKNILLYCTRPGWSAVQARVAVAFGDVAHNPTAELGDEGNWSEPHYVVDVVKVDENAPETLQAKTTPPSPGYPGQQLIGSDAFRTRSKGNGKFKQRTGIHESGHIFGLGDTYVDPYEPTRTEPKHQGAITRELGQKEPIRDDDRLMSLGERVVPSDAVTFVEAIRKATQMKEWSLTAPASTPAAPPAAPAPPAAQPVQP